MFDRASHGPWHECQFMYARSSRLLVKFAYVALSYPTFTRFHTNTYAYSNIHCSATHCSRAWRFVATRCFLRSLIASRRCHSSGRRLRVPRLRTPATKPSHKPTAMPPPAMRPMGRIRLWARLRLRPCRCESVRALRRQLARGIVHAALARPAHRRRLNRSRRARPPRSPPPAESSTPRSPARSPPPARPPPL